MDTPSLTCGLVFIAIIGILLGGLIIYLRNLDRINKQLREAHANYQQSLGLLRQQPNDPEFRRRALEWGRYYSNLTRNNKGVTIYDEVALANDINAACAGAVYVGKESAAEVVVARPIEDRLGQLKTLLESGAISEQEYNERRNKLLDEV
jgi:hypothetical protein